MSDKVEGKGLGASLQTRESIASIANEIILESISDGVFTVDHEWRITSFNRAAEEITGIARAEAVGRFCWEVFRSNMCEGDCALKRTMKEEKSFVSFEFWVSSFQFTVTIATFNEQVQQLWKRSLWVFCSLVIFLVCC